LTYTHIVIWSTTFSGLPIQVTVSMTDSRRKMLAKRRQSGLMMAMADDTESAVDASTLTGKERRSLPVVSVCHYRLRTTHLPASTMSSWVAAAASRCRLLTTGCFSTHPVLTSPPAARSWEVPPSVDLYAGVKFWTFLTSMEGVDLYADQLIC